MIADVLIGQTRTPEQKLNNEATFFLSKSRAGKDGFFYSAIFDTSLTKIEVKELTEDESRIFTKRNERNGSGTVLSKKDRQAIMEALKTTKPTEAGNGTAS